jgi:hypothetical protein
MDPRLSEWRDQTRWREVRIFTHRDDAAFAAHDAVEAVGWTTRGDDEQGRRCENGLHRIETPSFVNEPSAAVTRSRCRIDRPSKTKTVVRSAL